VQNVAKLLSEPDTFKNIVPVAVHSFSDGNRLLGKSDGGIVSGTNTGNMNGQDTRQTPNPKKKLPCGDTGI
jgi:hypothetical protein